MKDDFEYAAETWNGFRMRNFALDGVPCVLVDPDVKPAEGRPWYWRARFFGAFPDGDLALLRRGWSIAHIDVPELYGGPESNRRFDLLYDFMVRHGYAKKPVLVGYSRGGLDVMTWSAKHPERVGCIYMDNAVCDMKSWPGGKGTSAGGAAEWEAAKKAWGLDEAQMTAFDGNPKDDAVLKPLAAAGIRILFLVGDADTVVPPDENGLAAAKRFRELGGTAIVVHKPGMEHHPHCLADPTPIVEFAEGIGIRELKAPEELDIVRKIADDIWPKTFKEILAADQIPYMMERMYGPGVLEAEAEKGRHFAALFVGGGARAAGFASYAAYEGRATEAKLHKVYLLKEYQGLGYGRMMIDYVAEQCRASGFKKLRLNVNKHNEKAISAYKRAGFAVSEAVKNDIGHGYFMDDYVMTRTL